MENVENMSLGEIIKHYRLLRGIPQETLSLLVGYKSRNAIYNIEHGRSGMPTEKLIKVADILGIDNELLLSALKDNSTKQLVKENKTDLTIDVSFLNDKPRVQRELTDRINVLIDLYKSDDHCDGVLFYDLRDFSSKDRKLIKNIVGNLISEFEESRSPSKKSKLKEAVYSSNNNKNN